MRDRRYHSYGNATQSMPYQSILLRTGVVGTDRYYGILKCQYERYKPSRAHRTAQQGIIQLLNFHWV